MLRAAIKGILFSTPQPKLIFSLGLKTTLVPELAINPATTFSRTGTAYTTDFEGREVLCKSGELRKVGTRRVENLLTITEDFSSAYWDKGNITPAYNSVIAPDGTLTAPSFTVTAQYAYIAGWYAYIAGRTYRVSFLAKRISGANTLHLWLGHLNASGGAYSPDGTWRRYSFIFTVVTTGSNNLFLFNDRNSSGFGAVSILKPIFEDVTGQTNTNPSEYIGASSTLGSADSVRNYTYLNGNTVTNNIVTEAIGSAISPALFKGGLFEPAATNYYLQSNTPATRTIALTAGTYTIQVVGSGSITLSGGATGTVTSASFLTFTTSGSTTFTLTGSLTRVIVNAGVVPSSRIDTTTAAVSRDSDKLYIPQANINPTGFGIALTFIPTYAPLGRTVYLIGSYINASNGTYLLHDGTSLILRKRISGVNYDSSIVLGYMPSVVYRIGVSCGSKGFNVAVNGTLGVTNPNGLTAVFGSTIQIGGDGQGSGQPSATIKDIFSYNKALSNSKLASISNA